MMHREEHRGKGEALSPSTGERSSEDQRIPELESLELLCPWSGHMHYCRLVVLSYLSAHKAWPCGQVLGPPRVLCAECPPLEVAQVSVCSPSRTVSPAATVDMTAALCRVFRTTSEPLVIWLPENLCLEHVSLAAGTEWDLKELAWLLQGSAPKGAALSAGERFTSNR